MITIGKVTLAVLVAAICFYVIAALFSVAVYYPAFPTSLALAILVAIGLKEGF